MSKKAVVVTLTFAEAVELSFAAGEVMEAGDIVTHLFPNGKERAAARRSYSKLNASIRAANTKGKLPSPKADTEKKEGY